MSVVGDLKMDFFTTSINSFKKWSAKNSLWTYCISESCCSFEFENVAGARFDWQRFGAKLISDPSQCDLLIVAGPVNSKSAKRISQIYNEMISPKYVIAMGACANSGGIYRQFSPDITGGVDKIIPVDVYVPGCPPRPEAFLHGLLTLQKKIEARPNV